MSIDIDRYESPLLKAIVLIFAVLFFLKAAEIHQTFSTHAYDMGIFVQNFWLLSSFGEGFNTVRGIHALGDHFQPIQILFAPLYRVFTTPLLLFLLQVLAVAWAALILHRIAIRQLPDHHFVAFAIALAYLINPVVHNPLLWHYHALVLASPLFLLWFQAYLEGNDKRFFVYLVLLLCVREDIFVTTLSFGAVALFHRRWRLGVVTIVLSLAWWLFVSKVAMPFFNSEGYFRHKGYTVDTLLSNLFDLQYYVRQFWENGEALKYLAYIFLPLLMLSLRSPVWLLPAVPSLLANVLIGGYNTQIWYHYSVYAIPFVFMAAIMSLQKILKSKPRLAPWFAAGILIITVLSFTLGSRLSLRHVYSDWRTWQTLEPLRERVSDYDQALGPDSGISASDALLPHLANRNKIYLFPNPWKVHHWGIRGERPHHPNQVDYILIDPGLIWGNYRLLQFLQNEGYFVSEYQDGRLLVLRRIKPEPDDREVAVTNANNYQPSAMEGAKFGQPLLSPVYPYTNEGFKVPPFNPDNSRPPEKWQDARSAGGSLIKLDLQPTTKAVAYAARYIYVPITVENHQQADLIIGSDDTLEVWFEGESLLKNMSPRAARLGDNSASLQLRPGVNHLYFRVDNLGGAWRLIAELKPKTNSS